VANRSKAKGTSFETAIVNWLGLAGVGAQRLPLSGNKDRGDIAVPEWGLNIEAKNCRTLALAQWVAEADAEAINAGKPVVVVAKRVGKSDPGQAYVVMPLHVLLRLLQSAQSGIVEQ
jgi:hypothetical protein